MHEEASRSKGLLARFVALLVLLVAGWLLLKVVIGIIAGVATAVMVVVALVAVVWAYSTLKRR